MSILAILSGLLIGGALFYAGLLVAFRTGFRHVFGEKRPSSHGDTDEEKPFVSVVIAARNEAANIEACLHAVCANDYPADRYEVLVVDDFSTDATPTIVRRFQKRLQQAAVRSEEGTAGGTALASGEVQPRLRLLRMNRVSDVSSGHKRAALNHGITAARGPIILTTDADCTPSPGWIRAMADRFAPNVAFVAGPVRNHLDERGPSLPARIFDRIQALEFLSLQAAGAGSIGLGRPTICNSANVAYRQRVYEALYRPETLGAADDETLIQRITQETDWQVAFCPAPEAIVETPPAASPRAFLRQRQRWASMTPRYPDRSFTFVLGGVYGFYVLLLVALVAAVGWPALFLPIGAAFGIKVAAEALLLAPTCRHFRQPKLLRFLLPAQPLHLPYMVYIVAAGVLQPVEWKGRQLG